MIADMMFAWARERGAIDFSHWFFPLRGGGGDFRKGKKPPDIGSVDVVMYSSRIIVLYGLYGIIYIYMAYGF